MLNVQSLEYEPSHGRGRTLCQLNFQLGPGEILGILGPKGSGKTTLQNILIGIYRNYTGAVFFQDKELKNWSRDFYESIGTILPPPASKHGSKLTAHEHLEYFGSLYRGPLEPISDLLASVGLKQVADNHIRDFTPGMLARLSLARALLHKPHLLLLYEPLADMEVENHEEMLQLIQLQKRRGRAVILFTNDERLTKNTCDHIVKIEKGKISDTFHSPYGDML